MAKQRTRSELEEEEPERTKRRLKELPLGPDEYEEEWQTLSATFRENLERLRVAFNASQEGFANLLGTHRSNVTGWLGRTNPGLDEFARIVIATGVSPSWLLCGEEPRYRGMTRTKGELNDDLRQYLVHELNRRGEPGVVAVLPKDVLTPVVAWSHQRARLKAMEQDLWGLPDGDPEAAPVSWNLRPRSKPKPKK